MERIQQDPRLTANRSKSVNSSIAEEEKARGYVRYIADSASLAVPSRRYLEDHTAP